jgi:hypothetical protein
MDVSNFVCCICHSIPSSVAESGCCHSIFCWSCVLNNGKTPCPSCGKTLEPEMCNENVAIQKLIDKIPTVCKYEGCGAAVVSSAMKAHDEVCEYALVMCPNSELCGLLARKELAVHEREKCAFRTVRCHKCEDPLSLHELQNHLEQHCPNVLVSCVHNCLAKEILRSELTRHLTFDCMNAPVTCPFANHGCDRVILRGLVEAHLKDDAGKHIMLMKTLVEEQQNEIVNLREKVRVLEASPQINLNLERLEPFQPVLQRVYDDIRPRLRWASLFWLLCMWFGLMSVHGLVRVGALIFLGVKGYKRYGRQLRRRAPGMNMHCYRTAFTGVYVGVFFLLFLFIMKLC